MMNLNRIIFICRNKFAIWCEIKTATFHVKGYTIVIFVFIKNHVFLLKLKQMDPMIVCRIEIIFRSLNLFV